MPEFKIARVVIDAEIGLFADLVVKELCGAAAMSAHKPRASSNEDAP